MTRSSGYVGRAKAWRWRAYHQNVRRDGPVEEQQRFPYEDTHLEREKERDHYVMYFRTH